MIIDNGSLDSIQKNVQFPNNILRIKISQESPLCERTKFPVSKYILNDNLKPKEQWLNYICKEAGEYIKRGRSDLAYTQIRKFFQEVSKRNKDTNALISKDGKILMETEQKIKRWKKYLEELHNENLNEKMLEKEETLEKDDKGKYIFQSEFDAAVKYTKNNKQVEQTKYQ